MNRSRWRHLSPARRSSCGVAEVDGEAGSEDPACDPRIAGSEDPAYERIPRATSTGLRAGRAVADVTGHLNARAADSSRHVIRDVVASVRPGRGEIDPVLAVLNDRVVEHGDLEAGGDDAATGIPSDVVTLHHPLIQRDAMA